MKLQTVSWILLGCSSNLKNLFLELELYVDEVDLYITEKYLNESYNSCKNVQFPSTGQLALDVMCGGWGASKCSAKRWFAFFGDVNEDHVPLQMNYKAQKTTAKVGRFTPLNPRIVPCDESVDVSYQLPQVLVLVSIYKPFINRESIQRVHASTAPHLVQPHPRLSPFNKSFCCSVSTATERQFS